MIQRLYGLEAHNLFASAACPDYFPSDWKSKLNFELDSAAREARRNLILFYTYAKQENTVSLRKFVIV